MDSKKLLKSPERTVTWLQEITICFSGRNWRQLWPA
jgi:hypothetical protein